MITSLYMGLGNTNDSPLPTWRKETNPSTFDDVLSEEADFIQPSSSQGSSTPLGSKSSKSIEYLKPLKGENLFVVPVFANS